MEISILNLSTDANKGDLAILEATVDLLRRTFPRSRIALFNVDYSPAELKREDLFPYVKKMGFSELFGSLFPRVKRGQPPFREMLGAVINLVLSLWILLAVSLLRNRSQKLLPPRARRPVAQIHHSKLVILKGGSYLYSYGGIKQLLFLYRMFYLSLIALFLRKKIIALGHSFGPFQGRGARALARSCLKRFDKIAVRETISRDSLLHELGIDSRKLEVLPDLAFWLPSSSPKNISEGEEELAALNALPSPRIGITVRSWHFPGRPHPRRLFQNYLESMARFVEGAFHELGAACVFMPHAREDIPVAEQVIQLTRAARPLLLRGDYTCPELRNLYGRMDVFVATRIHSGIFALTAGTPVLAIAYEVPKGFGIIGMVEGKEFVLDINRLSTSELLEKTRKILLTPFGRKNVLREKMALAADKLAESVPNLLRSVLEE